MSNFLRGHVDAFEAWQGAPREIWCDNLKSVVIERRGTAVHFNPRYLDFAGHYRFLARPVAIARGNEKGRVERSKGDCIEIPELIAELARKKRHARHLRGQDRLVKAAPNSERLLEEAAKRGCHLGSIVGAPHSNAVRLSLTRRPEQQNKPPPIPVELPEDPKVRDIAVRDHDLTEYDGLAGTFNALLVAPVGPDQAWRPRHGSEGGHTPRAPVSTIMHFANGVRVNIGIENTCRRPSNEGAFSRGQDIGLQWRAGAAGILRRVAGRHAVSAARNLTATTD